MEGKSCWRSVSHPLLPPMVGCQPIANSMTHADLPDRSGTRTWCGPGEYSSGPTVLEVAANQTKGILHEGDAPVSCAANRTTNRRHNAAVVGAYPHTRRRGVN
jgi:hypothetical protein